MRAEAKERQIKALRQLKQTFAPAIAMQARIMQEAAAKLIELHGDARPDGEESTAHPSRGGGVH